MKKRYTTLLAAFFIIMTTPLYSQDKAKEEGFAYSGLYLQKAGDNAVLFTGKVEPPLAPGIQSMYLRRKGFTEKDDRGREIYPRPLPHMETYTAGRLVYDGVAYENVKMRLDLVRDDVAVLSPLRQESILLERSRFGSADFHGYRIIYLDGTSGPAPGYYLELYPGKHSVLKKETFHFDAFTMEFGRRVIQYFIRIDGQYRQVRPNKSAVLKLLKKHHGRLDSYITGNRIDIKKDAENALPAIVAEFERLEK